MTVYYDEGFNEWQPILAYGTETPGAGCPRLRSDSMTAQWEENHPPNRTKAQIEADRRRAEFRAGLKAAREALAAAGSDE